MPIYEYRCDACGHKLEVIQKVNDAPLTACPACDASALQKMVSAGGFQLKGSGWYATESKRGKGKEAPAAAEGGDKAAGDTAKGGCGGGSCGCH
ncbi:MAG: FmdB family zinc ribbon protein [Acidiferrobacteraceae bacterium]